jgi:hypothetical protein
LEESNQDAIRGGVLARMVDDVGKARFFDIRIMDAEGVNEIQPAAPVKVTIELRRPLGDFVDPSEMQAVHFAGEGAKLLNTNIESETAVSFDAKSFSIYGVVTIETESGVFTFEDGEYVITISYTKEANLKVGTLMTVREVEFGTDEYWTLWN